MAIFISRNVLSKIKLSTIACFREVLKLSDQLAEPLPVERRDALLVGNLQEPVSDGLVVKLSRRDTNLSSNKITQLPWKREMGLTEHVLRRASEQITF